MCEKQKKSSKGENKLAKLGTSLISDFSVQGGVDLKFSTNEN